MKADNPFDLLLPAAMAKVAEEAGVYKATKHPMKTFYLAITAGVFISIAFVFYITRPPALRRCLMGLPNLSGGICFSLGLILCVICGADLFTSTVLIVVAKASGRITWGQLAKTGSTSILVTWWRAAVCAADVVIRRIYDCQRRLGAKRSADRRPQNAPYFCGGREPGYPR
ncbi:formate transporter [Klebsiella pneumoniae]|uniref:Formate transporter n=1 Tax=Klebsiella pneumoniae TaxID=573 RepID=A0A378F851_KLEPN|nr:formate transporter [Klebsiella pneumoniae]